MTAPMEVRTQHEASSLLPNEAAIKATDVDTLAPPTMYRRQQLQSLLSMAIQLSINQMVRRVFLVTDTAFLGHLGTKELAGAALANLWINVPFNSVQYTLTILASTARGAGEFDQIGLWLQTSLLFALVACVPVGLLHLFVGDLVGMTMHDQATIAFAQQYGFTIAIGLLPRYLYACLTAYFATIDVVQPATITSLVAITLNVALNQVLIYGIDGYWSGLGFIGSPLASALSSCVQLALFATYTIGWKQYHVPYWNGWTRAAFRTDQIATFLALLLPMAASSLVDWASLTIAGSSLSILAPSYSAANAVLLGLFGVMYACASGFSAATQIYLSRSIGAGNMPAAKTYLMLGVLLMALMAALLMSCLAVIQRIVFGLWTSDHAVLHHCVGAFVPFSVGVGSLFFRFLLSSSANAVGLERYALFANNVGAWLVFIPLTQLSVVHWHGALRGYWGANALSEIIKIVLLGWGLARRDWTVHVNATSKESEA
ncbi:hypothetical protein SDRG_15270 [Saprolegnia diclina VS20]|uniref:MATE efflux family protein n=1 Tax=Saprolegnia diclina (strain VS20) TaxID=1156394 RepID=T0R4F8_SAPDV|nr:hypothetical protein SDRG_15270 [Saprolegnia diclina VS20]EQC26938.1 hypothetical protein SDRG_15270 [Saprolegnia diclina VS20]|eukprot:XP_008619659.1 hypothetical protein SDRG_15270 [Saprolegnia diclina VS20]